MLLAVMFLPKPPGLRSELERVGAFVEKAASPDPTRLSVSAALFADTVHGQLLASGGHLSVTMSRVGPGAIWKTYTGPPLPTDPVRRELALARYRVQSNDVRDAVNQLLGKDPEQRRPRRLGWEALIELLARHQILATEEALIDAPFSYVFSDELQAELRS
jgi:hypothetical protein